MKIHNRGKFHDYRNSPFWKVFAPLLHQYGPILPKSSPEVVLWQTKTLLENFLKDSKGRTQSSHFCSNFDPSFPPKNDQNWKKISSSAETFQPLSHPNVSKWSLYLISPFREKLRLLFAIFGINLPGNRAGSQARGVESKFDKYYFIHTIPGQLPVKTFWFKYFPVLWL